ncbi:biotin carboxylase N-terminal domain-containing protein [Umezawaea beigongshangensis]|uniref:ATP-binding protein n=1 Tax=Umezawaea beigongshangensis TaxID=2780383 RepID=UPI0018F17BF7|nr:biotin carboxylase N-terminal domain-containing protein [Umezawaea beigongshangensis]
MITRLLVANRGEIARRIVRTCRELGVGTVAVFSDPDEHEPFVAEADLAVRLPGATPAETYLRGDAIVAAATAAGADAVHPGYGFLSENADFARAVLAAGLTWVGPPPDVVEGMGSKIAAKQRMAAAGVPVLPELAPQDVTAADLPLLVKASAGGGGRGMRIVRSLGELADQLAGARREAESAFGDGTVFCEPLLTAARHVEVQVLADEHGTVWALGERECSIQRRHQKIVEETPSPAVDEALRARLCDAAVTAARAVGYVGAGTVEFLLDERGAFHFLEVNTRLQVEHPVTELVFGLDLVAWQLAVAEGAALPPEPPEPSGHAIEVRLCAEDPACDWRPSTGTLLRFDVPLVPGVRLDSGVETGSEVGVHYDPMLAKVIAWAPHRHAAARTLAAVLRGTRVHGLVTNRDLLADVLSHPAFLAGDTHTGFLDEHGLAGPRPAHDPRISALAAALAQAAGRRRGSHLPSGWRNVVSQPQRVSYLVGDDTVRVEYRHTRDGVLTDVPAHVVSVRSAGPQEHEVVLELAGVRHRFAVALHGDRAEVDSPLGAVSLLTAPRFPDPAERVLPGAAVAVVPGTVVRIGVGEGDRVAAGTELLVLEAMKMEHRVLATTDGTVAEVRVRRGDQVDAGDVLIVVEEQ